MAEQEEIVQEPAIRDRTRQPSGVLPKNLKPYLYGGAVILLIVATLISGHTKPAGGSKAAKDTPPQPLIQDQTAGNVAEMRNELAQEKQKEAQDAALAQSLASQNPAQQGAILGYGPDGRPIRGTTQPQSEPQPQQSAAPDPAQQAAIQLEADEKKRIDNAYSLVPRSSSQRPRPSRRTLESREVSQPRPPQQPPQLDQAGTRYLPPPTSVLRKSISTPRWASPTSSTKA
jgi:hypothetical protein